MMCDSSRLPGYVEAVSTKSGTVGPQCCIVYDKFHILQPAGQAVDEVRRAEFFRREVPRGIWYGASAGCCLVVGSTWIAARGDS
jgi:Transposase